MESHLSIQGLSDEQLIDEVDRLVKAERGATAHLIVRLAEFDRRLAPHLTATNHKALLAEARHKSKRDVELLVAKHRPVPPVPSTVRKLPALIKEPPVSAVPEAPATQSVLAAPPAAPQPASRRPLVKPLSAESYRLQITMSVATHNKLRKVQALMRHRIPIGDPAAIFDKALDALLRDVEKTKCARVDHPRQSRLGSSDSRHVPSSVKREAWKRDGGRCVFESPDGRRCAETDFLEFHHVVPYARGGRTTVDNLELRCRAHNAYEAERDFGLLTAT